MVFNSLSTGVLMCEKAFPNATMLKLQMISGLVFEFGTNHLM
jgi:hypothetical protein